MAKLFIVHCVDTEGPMYESVEATFFRLKNIFGISLPPTAENLKKLQGEKIDLNGLEKAVANLLAPQRLHMNSNWDEIDKMVSRLNSPEFRNFLTGDADKPWVFSWFCLEHVGFTGENPRYRTLGDHKVYDHYRELIQSSGSKDIVQWHYHPLPATGHVNDSGIAYLTSNNVWEILCKKIIQRKWFPSSFRPGFHTVRPDSHWFLEQWIPFDYGNQSCLIDDTDQPDLANGRYGDWRRAPNDWSVYQPSHDDYQTPGNCRRWIARCLNVEARLRQITDADIEGAFERSANGKNTLMAMTNHDFRDMYAETIPVIERIKRVMSRYPDVEVVPIDAVNGIRQVLNLPVNRVVLRCHLESISDNQKNLTVELDGDLFGTQPFLAIELNGSRYLWENFDEAGEKRWSFVFDNNHIPADQITAIGVAANSTSGYTAIANFRIGDEEWVYNNYDE